jgi:hypothetical protein
MTKEELAAIEARARERAAHGFEYPCGDWNTTVYDTDGDEMFAALIAHVREVRAALTRVEWYEAWGSMCPICERCEVDGHAPDCEMAAALGKSKSPLAGADGAMRPPPFSHQSTGG